MSCVKASLVEVCDSGLREAMLKEGFLTFVSLPLKGSVHGISWKSGGDSGR